MVGVGWSRLAATIAINSDGGHLRKESLVRILRNLHALAPPTIALAEELLSDGTTTGKAGPDDALQGILSAVTELFGSDDRTVDSDKSVSAVTDVASFVAQRTSRCFCVATQARTR
jgi:hypothetical protein